MNRLQQIAYFHWGHTESVDNCEDPECLICGTLLCPHAEPLHFHHDGCPSCSDGDEQLSFSDLGKLGRP